MESNSSFQSYFCQLVNDYEQEIKQVKYDRNLPVQLYVDALNDIQHNFKNKIYSHVCQNTTEETFGIEYFLSFPFMSKLQRFLERHIEDYLINPEKSNKHD